MQKRAWPYLVVVPVDDGEGRLLGQLLRGRAVMEEGLGALACADLPDAGHVQPSSIPVLLGRLPAEAGQVRVQGVEAAVDPGIGADLLQLTPTLHECQAVRRTAYLGGGKLVSIYSYLSRALLPAPATFFSEGMLLKDTVFFLPPPIFCTEGSCRNM